MEGLEGKSSSMGKCLVPGKESGSFVFLWEKLPIPKLTGKTPGEAVGMARIAHCTTHVVQLPWPSIHLLGAIGTGVGNEPFWDSRIRKPQRHGICRSFHFSFPHSLRTCKQALNPNSSLRPGAEKKEEEKKRPTTVHRGTR